MSLLTSLTYCKTKTLLTHSEPGFRVRISRQKNTKRKSSCFLLNTYMQQRVVDIPLQSDCEKRPGVGEENVRLLPQRVEQTALVLFYRSSIRNVFFAEYGKTSELQEKSPSSNPKCQKLSRDDKQEMTHQMSKMIKVATIAKTPSLKTARKILSQCDIAR